MSPFVDTLHLLALAGALASASGCSLRYDPDDLGDDGADEDDGTSVDPDELFVERVFPPLVYEGEGVALDPDEEAAVRAVPIVLYGQNMTAETTFAVAGDGIDNQTVEAQVSPDGHWAAFAIRLPIVPDDTDAHDVDLIVRVSSGDQTREVELTHRLLPELRVMSSGKDNLAVVPTDDLPRDEKTGISAYSRVELSGGTIQLRGEAPFRVIGYGGISVSGLLESDAEGPTPGGGGCEGGAPERDAPCAAGSGKGGGPGATPGGGGGGGFGSQGVRGEGPKSLRGEGGPENGDPSLVPMTPDESGPAGGGGSGAATLGDGATGGGSGGIIELTTPGLLVLRGSVRADGADGECAAPTTGAGGGGGSGGAILVRAGSLPAEGTSGGFQALGGEGGACTTQGGRGGDGRIRIDLPAAPVDVGVSTVPDTAFRGPAFVTAAIPTISAERDLQVTIHGAPDAMYELSITSPEGATDAERTEPVTIETGSEGAGELTVELWEGFNRLCLRAMPSKDPDSYPEAANCLNVAYISR
jgi:hypothetical protein